MTNPFFFFLNIKNPWKFQQNFVIDQYMVYAILQNLHFKISWASSVYASFFSWLMVILLYRRVYALDVVGVIPQELWNLTFLFNLYGFFFISLFTWVLHECWLPSFSCKLGLNLDLETVVHYVNQLKFILDVVYSKDGSFSLYSVKCAKFRTFLTEIWAKISWQATCLRPLAIYIACNTCKPVWILIWIS